MEMSSSRLNCALIKFFFMFVAFISASPAFRNLLQRVGQIQHDQES